MPLVSKRIRYITSTNCTTMLLIRLKGSPYVLRYYPDYERNMYQYHKIDQNPVLFEVDRSSGVVELSGFRTDRRAFSSIVDVYLFITSCQKRIPENILDVFEVQRDKCGVWEPIDNVYMQKRTTIDSPI